MKITPSLNCFGIYIALDLRLYGNYSTKIDKITIYFRIAKDLHENSVHT